MTNKTPREQAIAAEINKNPLKYISLDGDEQTVKEICSLIASLGYVKKAKDQSLPDDFVVCTLRFNENSCPLLRVNFVKVEKE